MIRLQLQVNLGYTVQAPSTDFFFYIHAAHTAHQKVTDEALVINPSTAHWRLVANQQYPGQSCLRVRAQTGPLQLQYSAVIEMQHHTAEPATLHEVSMEELPLEVLPYIYPSRYCQSDRLTQFAMQEFGQMAPGYGRAQAICNWVREHVTFRSNSSDVTTSAIDTLIERVGVCRDFAHLMIALCRACSLPARMVTGTDYGADPTLGPPDFHAYVEVYLSHRWYLFDPSGTAIPMGMMRLATGRDAADVAFSTIFGYVHSDVPRILVMAMHDEERGWKQPVPTHLALSTA